jgi:DNA helicase II / ATP-dependent DNA helicase PcrA
MDSPGFKFFFGYGMAATVMTWTLPSVTPAPLWLLPRCHMVTGMEASDASTAPDAPRTGAGSHADRPGSPTQHITSGLDAQQRAAITSTAAPLAIIASAGSGKTTVLTRRIAHRIATGSADARHVLALTFTREAAAELKRRLRRLDIRDRIEAGTFHSVAQRLLRDRALSRNETMPNIAPDRLRLLRECLVQLRLPGEPFQVAADVDWARARRIPPERFDAACRAAKRRSAIPAGRFAELLAAYTQLKRRKGVVDFDDLLEQLHAAITTDQQFAALVRWRFRHLFVDEAQDLNPLQHAMLEAIRGGRPDLCLVGDPRQAIYGWNGADPSTLADVEVRYPGVTVLPLNANYRCSPQIVRAAAAALRAGGGVDDTVSRRADGPAITISSFADEAEEAAAVASHVRSLLNHRPANDVAVLARTNELLTEVQHLLGRHGVATERAGGRTPLDLAIGEAARIVDRDALATWADRVVAESDPIRRLVGEEVERYLAADGRGGLRAWFDNSSALEDIADAPAREAVSLLTLHAAKGREWGAVALIGVEDRLVPHSSAISPAQVEEESRLFYVGITRSSSQLLITYAQRRDGNTTGPSPWLDAVRASTADDLPVAPPIRRVPRAVDPLGELKAWRAAVARSAGVPDQAICSDRVLRSLLESPPESAAALAERLGITELAAARLRPLPHRAAEAAPRTSQPSSR